jgi:hypothetical protein
MMGGNCVYLIRNVGIIYFLNLCFAPRLLFIHQGVALLVSGVQDLPLALLRSRRLARIIEF